MHQNITRNRQTDQRNSFADQYFAKTGKRYFSNGGSAEAAASTAVPAGTERQPLTADAAQIAEFYRIAFKNCAAMGGFIRLAAFQHANNKCLVDEYHPLNAALVRLAAEKATAVARRAAEYKAVFAPPMCLFQEPGSAKSDNVLAAPLIILEMDENPRAGLRLAEQILGAATLVVMSGGKWTSPDGVSEDKLHAYWRLKTPAVTAAERDQLRAACSSLAKLAGGDTTAASPVHPMRLPGSYHTKTDTARLCMIIGGDQDREIELAHAAGLINSKAQAQNSRDFPPPRDGFKTPEPWPASTLMEVAKALPNSDRNWDDWCRIGMAFYDASHGSVDGCEAFHAFSEKHSRYDADATDERWSHWSKSPPSSLSAGTLVYEIRKFVGRHWTPRLVAGKAAKVAPSPSAVIEDGPLDIFGEADPGELGDLPDGALPPMMTRWIRSEAKRKGTPEAFAAISIATVFGAAIGADVRLQVLQKDDSWTETGNLFATILAPPGHTKSPMIGAATAPLRTINTRWIEQDGAIYAQWLAASKKRGKDAPPLGPEPRIRRAVVDDMTSEKAVRIYRDNPRGVLQAPDELAGLLGQFSAYKSGVGADRSHFLRTFDGDSLTSDRVGSGTITAKRASLSVLASTQPAKMASLVRDLGSDGLLQRFIVVLHDGRERPQVDEEPDREAAAWFSSSIEKLAAAGNVMAPPIRQSPEAAAILSEALNRIKALKHVPGASDAFKGHLEKWGKILPRLVLIVHAAHSLEAEDGLDLNAVVDGKTAATAVRFARFLLRHALTFYATYFGNTISAVEAVWIAGWLLTRPDLKVITRRDVYDARKSLRGQENLKALLAAMGELEAAGWCSVKERDASGPTSWAIDERIHARFAERAERERAERGFKRAKILEAGQARQWINEQKEERSPGSGGIFE